jgi:hypothetical protein
MSSPEAKDLAFVPAFAVGVLLAEQEQHQMQEQYQTQKQHQTQKTTPNARSLTSGFAVGSG